MPTITVEDGTGSTSSNSYVSVAYVDSYCSDHGLTAWADGLLYDRQTAILRSMAYVESKTYSGQKYANTNALQWPRKNALDRDGVLYDGDSIPSDLKKAVARGAYEELVSPGCLQANLSRSEFVKREKVDVIDITYESGKYSTQYTVVDGYLCGLTSNRVRIVRT